jgi:hypothetical protein
VGNYITLQITEHEQAKANAYQKDNDLDSIIPF